jgi:hypothetical protein
LAAARRGSLGRWIGGAPGSRLMRTAGEQAESGGCVGDAGGRAWKCCRVDLVGLRRDGRKEAGGGRPAHATTANHRRTTPRPATHAHPTDRERCRGCGRGYAGAPSEYRSRAGRDAGDVEGATPAELQARAGRLPA